MTLSFFCMCFCLAAIDGQHALESATSAMEAVTANWFPEDIEFNDSCVAEGCPTLKNISLCPTDLDIDALREITRIISKCMKGLMCGIITDPRLVKPLVATMEEFLPGFQIDGIVKIPPDSSYLTNISNIQLQMSSSENQQVPLQVAMLIPNLRAYGRVHIDARLDTNYAPALTASLTQSTFDIGIQFISTISVNKSINGDKFDIRLVNPIVRARPLLCGFDMPLGFPDIQSLFTSTVQIIVEKSTMAKTMGNFMERLYESSIQVVLRNCKQFKDTE